MEQENIGQRFLPFFGVQSSQINACIEEGLVGGCKDRERPGPLEGFGQLSLDQSRHQ